MNKKVIIEIDCENAAFDSDSGGGPGYEIARILRKAAKRLEDGDVGDDFRVFDVNGNGVGNVSFAGDWSEDEELDPEDGDDDNMFRNSPST